ncbi:hypothetical protein ACYG9Z_09365 [Mesorhizobium sp. RSR380A]|uniref:hypothetical protein n=1 Tax=unclassified Mesorhizobium TaxID=325217 RepID=UPI0003CE2DB7|nr:MULTISPECIES: hypothetical protein [unclassified Mesorhizobium]ESX94531.1 hypothetical protein X754_16535 [Mesorhizobium sp. LNJC403B00]ESY50711.1 hypothetical protein X746_03225 [Mesorhizobium sp. LNJC380A00]
MAKARHSLAWMTLQENLRGILITILVVGVCGLAIGIPIARQSSPIANVERLTGTVVNVLNAPASPEVAIGSGFRYLYGIRLDENDGLVFAYDNTTVPRAIGSKVSIERQRRRNDTETYRLLRE